MKHPYIPDIEFLPLPEVKKYQEGRLKETLAYLEARSPYYRKVFSDNRIDIAKITKLEDLVHVPPTEKNELRLHNRQFLCVPEEELIDYMTTSGTLGDPVVVAANEHDLDRLAYNEAICFQGVGVEKGDVYQLMTTLDKRFMAGMAYYVGLRKLGAGVCRVGNGLPEFQWDTISLLKPVGIVCVPSFILRLIEFAEQAGIDYRRSSIKKAVCIGENLRRMDYSPSLLAQRIREKWDIELFSTYASTEMAHSFCECSAHRGGHLHPELMIAEILDTDGNQVKPGEVGELTITNLGVESMPLLRFRTGDICALHDDPCPCGRTTPRISPVLGRQSQMIKLKGTTLYPPAVNDVLDNLAYVKSYVVELSDTAYGTDRLTILLYADPVFEGWEKDLKDHFRSRLRIAPDIRLCSAAEIAALQGTGRKITKFIDKRKH